MTSIPILTPQFPVIGLISYEAEACVFIVFFFFLFLSEIQFQNFLMFACCFYFRGCFYQNKVCNSKAIGCVSWEKRRDKASLRHMTKIEKGATGNSECRLLQAPGFVYV